MTFFVDRDLGPGVGMALRSVGVDVVLHGDRFDADTSDQHWIATMTAESRVILTRDRHLRTHPAERAVFEDAGARAIVVATGASTPLDDLRSLLIAWPSIQHHLVSTPSPWMFGVSRDGRLTQYVPATGPGSPAERRAALETARTERREKRTPTAGRGAH